MAAPKQSRNRALFLQVDRPAHLIVGDLHTRLCPGDLPSSWTPHGQLYAYTYICHSSDLYMVQGLKQLLSPGHCCTASAAVLSCRKSWIAGSLITAANAGSDFTTFMSL